MGSGEVPGRNDQHGALNRPCTAPTKEDHDWLSPAVWRCGEHSGLSVELERRWSRHMREGNLESEKKRPCIPATLVPALTVPPALFTALLCDPRPCRLHEPSPRALCGLFFAQAQTTGGGVWGPALASSGFWLTLQHHGQQWFPPASLQEPSLCWMSCQFPHLAPAVCPSSLGAKGPV